MVKIRFRRKGMEEIKNFCFSEDVEETHPSDGVTRKVLSYSKNLMVCEMHFEKGAVGAMHHHPHEQISYIVSGVFEFTVGGRKNVVKAGDAVYKQSNIEHGAVCLEEGVLIDIFTPMREDFV